MLLTVLVVYTHIACCAHVRFLQNICLNLLICYMLATKAALKLSVLQAMASRNLVIIAQTLSVVARPLLLHYTLNILAESCKVEFDLWARGNSMTGRPTTHKVFMCMSLLMSLFMNICALCRMAYKRTSCRASMIALQRD